MLRRTWTLSLRDASLTAWLLFYVSPAEEALLRNNAIILPHPSTCILSTLLFIWFDFYFYIFFFSWSKQSSKPAGDIYCWNVVWWSSSMKTLSRPQSLSWSWPRLSFPSHLLCLFGHSFYFICIYSLLQSSTKLTISRPVPSSNFHKSVCLLVLPWSIGLCRYYWARHEEREKKKEATLIDDRSPKLG